MNLVIRKNDTFPFPLRNLRVLLCYSSVVDADVESPDVIDDLQLGN